MPRHPRIHVPGALYHLMARGNNGQPVYLDPADYKRFLDSLATTKRRYPFWLYAYVLMPNHFHLLVEVRASSSGRFMQSLLTGYAREFNRRHERRGHLFQGRYKAIVCDRDSYLVELTRYIHLNPVRAGLVRSPAQWPWSGHSEYLGRTQRGLVDVGPVLGALTGPAQYERFVREGAKMRYQVEWHPSESAPFLGIAARPAAEATRPTASRSRRVPLERLWQESADGAGVSIEALRQGGRSARLVAARDGFIQHAVVQGGYRAVEVAAFIGCHPANITRAVRTLNEPVSQHTQV